MTRFEFAVPGRVLFGPGCIREAGAIARQHGSRALVVTGKSPARPKLLLASFEEAGITSTLYHVGGEPDLESVDNGLRMASAADVDFVAAIGGGSVLDAGKAIAALLANGGELLDYLEVIGQGKPLDRPSRPFLAIPTTAGTGSEATRNAVLSSPVHRVKASLRGQFLLPALALVDPGLTCGLPRELTANTGMDAITQLLEAYVCRRANPLTDALCLDGLRRASTALRRACNEPNDLDARSDMSYAALLSGVALANAGLGAVHGFAGPLGGMFDAPHGGICAALLPHVMTANIAAAREPGRDPTGATLGRYAQIACLLTNDPHAEPEAGAAWMAQLTADLGILTLSAYGMRPEHAGEAVEKAARANSMKANPIALTDPELESVFLAALR